MATVCHAIRDKTFGDVSAYLYTIEFQKRGLSHWHTLLWVTPPFKINNPSDVDRYITAELLDPVMEPLLYSTITSCMLHGPCDMLNPDALCMQHRSCKKKYPKEFNTSTSIDKNGYIHYKRSESAYHTLQNGIRVHNDFVVPYNKRLCSIFNAHINVEYCGWNMMIKYLFKYISKSVEQVSFTIQRAETNSRKRDPDFIQSVNEIQTFLDGRFICPHEAAWRIFNFSIHERFPVVQILAIHLENMQTTTFRDNTSLDTLVRVPNFGKTTLTGWLQSNCRDPTDRHLTYTEYPSLFIWHSEAKEWIHRSRNTTPSVGRLVYIHPTARELFYLRMLLCHQKGCTSFVAIRTAHGVVYDSFRLACEALGLTDDDKEWLAAFNDATAWASSSELRSLFCHLLQFCEVSNPLQLWEISWKKLGDDLMYALTSTLCSATISVSDYTIQQQILLELERLLNSATPSISLQDFRLPLPSLDTLAILRNRLLLEETSYDRPLLQQQHLQMVSRLNLDQLNIHNKVREAETPKNSFCFLYMVMEVHVKLTCGRPFLHTSDL